MSLKVAVLGAGAIGGFIAAALSRAGNDVSVVARGGHLEAMRARGAVRVVSSDLGPFEAEVQAAADLRELPDPQFVLLTFKAHQWEGVTAQLHPAIARGAAIVTLQNGLPFWYAPGRPIQAVDPGGEIQRAIPQECVIGGVVHASGHIEQPGVIHQSGGMLYPMGELDGSLTPRIRDLSQAFIAAGLEAPVEPLIRRNIWRKVINNAALNPVSALTRSSMHPMLHDPATRSTLHRLIEEGIAVAKASGVDPQTGADERLKWAGRLADVKTSMLQDLEAGKPLELEPITGAVVELAQTYGVPVPVMTTVYALAKLLERSVPT